MRLGVVALNGEKMHSVRFELGYRLTSVVYKEILVTKVLPLAKKITKKKDYATKENGAQAYTAKTMQDWLDANMSYWFKNF